LVAQAQLIDPITTRFFADAGVRTGMRVLDVGSGAGDVAFLAAGLVGETGEVVGIDRAAPAVETATRRAAALGLRNVSFREGDPADLQFALPFDAVVGRYVLQFQDDPAAMLRSLLQHVRGGGIVVFHELDWNGIDSYPPVPLYDLCRAWCREAISRRGAETRMGVKLYSAFVGAGLPAPTMRAESVIAGGSNSTDQVRLVAALALTLVGEMEQLGIATAREVDPATLADRVVAQVASQNSVIVGHLQVGAWSRVQS
jgi:ubiquinone/menaquinone biosynthesis C-methylase UbiE